LNFRTQYYQKRIGAEVGNIRDLQTCKRRFDSVFRAKFTNSTIWFIYLHPSAALHMLANLCVYTQLRKDVHTTKHQGLPPTKSVVASSNFFSSQEVGSSGM
jgi:hypothetical protein